jgi:Cobalamin synthesis protein cobW C-terminal domain
MNKPSVIAVAGAAGVGKTAWITQQFSQSNNSLGYFCLKTEATPIDSVHLVTEFPQLAVFTDQQIDRLHHLDANTTVFVEIGFHLNLTTADSLLAGLDIHKVAVVPPNMLHLETEWHQWADVVEVGQAVSATEPKDLWRSDLSYQVIDPASIDTLWAELTQGAYGLVQRAKGIFDLSDGRSFYFDFVEGHKNRYRELNLPLWLENRPSRFSGLEVIGVSLDRQSIGDTLAECCLSDEAIAYYQAKIKENMLEPA